ncbi:MAG: hypothetical protein DIU62_012375 [Pseudomonadota bacterium]|jgi:hypothetical protein|nr:MAG: hypothetical protein DIU62_14515 [Pseudomonadota bacterium]
MLRPVQRLIETIYDAPTGQDVRDFLVTERGALPPERHCGAAEEELVLVQQRRGNYLALYIDAALLARLEQNNPLRVLDESNLGDFWTALEGVSHFSYLMWNARHARAVSQLDLELQAEVDKYIATWWLMRTQYPEHRPRELHHLLFERARVNPRLPPATQQMYAAASRYAARFCRALQAALLSNRPATRGRATAVLRRFYRMGSAGKRRYIEALP